MFKLFSIIIPTYGRSEQLDKLLHAISRLNYPKNSYEVLIVENSTAQQATQNLVRKYKKKIHNLKLLVEEKKGASFARNLGCMYSISKHLVFLDDDINIQPDFLHGYDQGWKKYPKAKMIGGRINVSVNGVSSLNKTQQEMLEKYNWIFSYLDNIYVDKSIHNHELIYSANMSYRLSSGETSIFDTRLGKRVTSLIYEQLGGEDYELCLRTLLHERRGIILSDSRVKVTHNVDKTRFSEEYIRHRFYLAGIEMKVIENILSEKFEYFSPFYLKNLCNFRQIKSLLFDKYQYEMLKGYFFGSIK